jgi:hypothetical protein
VKAKTERKRDSAELARTKEEWIESAATLNAERFEVAGALFDLATEKAGETEVRRRLKQYRGGAE